MLSPSYARPQQSARRAYVCLSCRLQTPRHHFATTANPRTSQDADTPRHSFQIHRAGGNTSAPARSNAVRMDSNPQGKLVRAHLTKDQTRMKRHQTKVARRQPKATTDQSEATEDHPSNREHRRNLHWAAEKEERDHDQHDFTALLEQHTAGQQRKDDFTDLLKQHTAAQQRDWQQSVASGEENQAADIVQELENDKGYARTIDTPPARLSPIPINTKDLPGTQLDMTSRRPTTVHANPQIVSQQSKRAYHKQTVAPKPNYGNLPPPEGPNSVRAKLRQWQEVEGKEMEHLFKDKLPAQEDLDEDSSNSLTRLSDTSSLGRRANDKDVEQEAIAHFSRSQSEDFEDDTTDPRFLFMGDLVEIEFANSEKESMLAVYVRRMGANGQFYTMNGRWLHLQERQVQYSIPGWVSPKVIEPLLKYLPNEADIEDLDALNQDAYVNDLSVPRHVAAPLVSRLVAFNRESLEIYRKHASTLDRAHDILAHQNDLRYGSLVSAATTLLKTPSDKLPLTALFTVRKALMHAGFAFNVDRRSHRLTGYLQIRSKEQVRMVEQVRGWLREWQDDLAAIATMNKKQQMRHVPSKGAAHVHRFIQHAKTIVTASRENRDATQLGTVGPSKVKREITKDQDAVKLDSDTRFNDHDQELLRFMEAWACSNMFIGLPRIKALPPLILQATGLYEEHALNTSTGYMFLQELGTILPYENRVRFDQHLLLPSSQHSKPLQTLMNNLIHMQNQPNFSDSMEDLRHDWGSLPVYCIDGPSAQEIDDGLSVERASHADSENPEWWVHIHIANPTAFFDRDHPLAKMARHMGETIYNPERTYMMLPRWATQRHFSLAKDRPCLTFSARLNEHGEVLENKIRSGYIRNVHRLTPEETLDLVGLKRPSAQKLVDITVGGNPPPAKERVSAVSDMKQNNIDDLKVLQHLAEKRQEVRKASGGVFFDSHRPEMSVWQTWNRSGLAWDHPHRKGARTVEGDPVINMQTRGLVNWFSAGDSVSDILVREMMLLACNISTQWCADRQVPTIYRGSVPKPGQIDPKQFYDEVCEPAIEKNNGEIPLHLGVEYIKTQGSVILSTKPLRHNLLGLDTYGKVTSPLRRYGDMILHWQIEAALRQEAKTGKSLTSSSSSLSGVEPNRSFLPFSSTSLQTIMLGLQPREGMISRAKNYADSFWIAMLMFRAHHYGEAKLPFETCHGYVPMKPVDVRGTIGVIFEEINVNSEMMRPDKLGLGLVEARAGDRWECTIDRVDVFNRSIQLRPVRLLSRWE